MGSIVLRSLSVLLGLFFIFVGILKISCFISKDLHRDLVSIIECFHLEKYVYIEECFFVCKFCFYSFLVHFFFCSILLQRKEYVKYAKVFPFSQLLGIKIPAKWYRKVIGSLEIICGLMLAFVPKGMRYPFLQMNGWSWGHFSKHMTSTVAGFRNV